MTDDMQRARGLLAAHIEDLRSAAKIFRADLPALSSLAAEFEKAADEMGTVAAALRAAPEGYALIRLCRPLRKVPKTQPTGKHVPAMIRILSEGPATTMEVAEEMCVDSRTAGARLASAWRRGWLAKKPYKDPQTGQIVQMWMLAEHAEALGGTLA